MSTLNLVRPELRAFVRETAIPAVSADNLAAYRAEGLPAFPVPDIPGLEVGERRVPGPSGAPQVRVLVYRSAKASASAPAILHIHGGGYVMGKAEENDPDNRQLAENLACVVVSVDYRLAPEHPFPAPLEDCYAALKWLHDNAPELGVDRERIAIKGESAGGGLAAALALLARDRGEVAVAYQCLTFPMLDDRPPAQPNPYVGEFIWTAESNQFGWASYLGGEPGGPDVSPYAAPSRAKDLSGLPAALIITLTLDLFLEENLDYARRLMRAGVPVELLVYPGAYHGYQLAGDTALGRRYERDCRQALADALTANSQEPHPAG